MTKKKSKRIRRRAEDEEGRVTQKKRKRRQPEEIDLDSLPPEQGTFLFWESCYCLVDRECLAARKLQVQMKIDAIVKSKKNKPKKRKKDAEEEALDRFADEEVSQLREDMLRAAAEDDEANKEKMPATAKLRNLPRVKEVLQK